MPFIVNLGRVQGKGTQMFPIGLLLDTGSCAKMAMCSLSGG